MSSVTRKRRTYRSRPGRDLAADFYVPDGPGAAPAVVFVHGGGWMTDHQGVFESHLRRLAERGVLGVELTHRLSSEARFPAQIADVKYALRWLKANAGRFGLDADRIVVGGHSAGAHLAALAAVAPDHPRLEPDDAPAASSRVHGAIPINGLFNLEKLGQIHPSRLFASEFIYELFGARYVERPDAYRVGSCVTHIDGEEPPFLILSSTADQEVPPYESTQLYDQLAHHGNAPERYVAPGGDHFCFFAGNSHYEEGMARIESFLAGRFESFPA